MKKVKLFKEKFHLECLVCGKELDNQESNCTHFVVRKNKK